MTNELRLQFLGGGKMAAALVGGLIGAEWASPNQLAVVERQPARCDTLRAEFPGVVVGDVAHRGVPTVVAVKPQDTAAALVSLAGLAPQRVLSIAAGVTLAALEEALDPGTAVVRSMPNTPALVGRGAAAIAAGGAADDTDLEWAASILRAVGAVEVVAEADLDAVTGLSGSGPAYVFAMAEALAEAGRAAGLDAVVARRLADQTLIGAAELLARSDDSPTTLRENVTSPGGTTAAGLASLDADDFAGAIARAVQAATERSRELGR